MFDIRNPLVSLSGFVIFGLFLNHSFDLNDNNGFLVNGQRFFSCTVGYCRAYGKCPEFDCRGPHKVVFRNATQCGCCHRCVEERDEGEICPESITGNIPSNQCAAHLKCGKSVDTDAKAKCMKVDTYCERNRTVIENNPSQAFIRAPKPECDEFGGYKSKQCKTGTLCQCADEGGNRIFGTAVEYESNSMNCLCSRQFENMNKKLVQYGSKALEPIHFMRCKQNGNYESLQTHNNYYYCVFPQNGTIQDRPVLSKYIKDLSCYKKSSHDFKTSCIMKYNEIITKITNKEEEGVLVVGFELPRCDLDGSYHPVQCSINKCTCVDKKGIPIKDSNGFMSVDRNDAFLSNSQKCTCARDMEMIRGIPDKKRDKITELYRRYQCNRNGNYLPIQCSDSACYCVDPITGYAPTTDDEKDNSQVLKSDPEAIRSLHCYKNYPDSHKQELDKIFRLS